VDYAPQVATQWAEKALEWAPHDPYSWNTLTTVLLLGKDCDRASTFAWVASKRFPEDVVACTSLAEVLKVRGQLDEAVDIYLQTIERFPDSQYACAGLARVLTLSQRYEEAIAVYERGIERFPDNNDWNYSGLADIYRRLGNYSEAERVLRKSIEKGFAGVATYFGLAYLLVRPEKRREGRKEALDLIEKVLQMRPNDIYALKFKQVFSGDQKGSAAALNGLIKSWEEALDRRNEGVALKEVPASPDEQVFKEIQTAEPVQQVEKESSAPKPKAAPKLAPTEESDVPKPEKTDDKAVAVKPDAPAPVKTVIAPAAPSFGYYESFDSIKVAGLIAEANFYRLRAKRFPRLAVECWERTSKLIDKAMEIAPEDSQVLAEETALRADLGDADPFDHVAELLEHHSSSLLVLALTHRLERERAQRELVDWTPQTLADLTRIPVLMAEREPALVPLSQFQKGMAALALRDGDERRKSAATAFSSFRKKLANRVVVEQKSANQPAAPSHFYEWLQKLVDAHVFEGVGGADTTEIRPEQVDLLDERWHQDRSLFEGVESVFVDRLVFRSI